VFYAGAWTVETRQCDDGAMRGIVKWDLHHHAVPDFYVQALHDAGVKDVGGFRFPRWSPDRSLREMDHTHTERAWLSVSAPGVSAVGITDPVGLARRLNDYGTQVVAGHPNRFGWWATLPQADVDASIAEVQRLNANEIVLLSNIDNVHFGHASLSPLWEVLDDRDAVVYVHPASRPGEENLGLLNPLYYWQNDTARTMLDFLRVGGHVKYPRIRWVLSHGGGPLPVLHDEALDALRAVRPEISAEVDAWRSHVYLDTASKAYDEQIPAILGFSGPSQVTFGSDFPWASEQAGAVIVRAWERAIDRLELGAADLAGIFKENAARLFRRETAHAVQTAVRPLTDFPRFTAPSSAVSELPEAFWDGDLAAIRERVHVYNASLRDNDLAVIDMHQPDDSIREIERARTRGVAGIRVPLDLSTLNGEHDFLDDNLVNALGEGSDRLRFEPREPHGIPLLDDRRLDAVLFTAKGQWLGKLNQFRPARVELAGTAGLLPYLAHPIDILHYLGQGKAGALGYAWDNYVTHHPKGYDWLRSTHRS
jgi:predicted TIM-barrel fold metal-dependent hydrolase